MRNVIAVEDQAGRQEDNSLTLPSILDLTAAEPLCRTLLERFAVADAIVLDGADVEQVSTAAIQVLLAAVVEARSRGISMRLDDPSEALISALRDLGLPADINC